MPRTKKTRSKSKRHVHFVSPKRAHSRRREVIPQPDRNMSLSQVGYSLSNSAEKRKKSLNAAINKYGYAAVLRRLKLVYALTPEPGGKHKAKKDMSYMTNFRDFRQESE